ncbi:LD-carboxypeptidase [Actinomadura barringtoniae]|uniref:LD-carboxypeptidase n=1 Tax=Actinomadura barringtoniae TaxID=1427535 RepID=A0A939T4Y2_9ACTN|nr:LD-carboxypeptidase [Actinomadura barringtoniae]MBO2449963.1 LD-carboxypeptidase [Actinomadura barringtoniae]
MRSGGARRFARLRPGDRVAVIAPSGPVDPGRLEAGCAVLRDLGLDPIVAKHALDRDVLGGQSRAPENWHRLAGSDADRALDLQTAWCDPEIRAVVCARGGYGATRILDLLDWDAMTEAAADERGPKLLHGSSDVTALHTAFGERIGITTAFGPMPATHLVAESPGEDRERSLEALRAVWFGADVPLTIPGAHALSPGQAEGPLTGGTLSMLTATLGTSYAPPPAAGSIVFLEDVNEAPYRVDRMLTQLLQAGWFDGAAGVVLGPWTGCGDPVELDAVVSGRLAPLGLPVLAGIAAGHGPRQLTLELGALARLDAGAQILTVHAPGGGVR